MQIIKRYGLICLTLFSYNAYAQLDSVGYLFKTNPFAQFKGELTFSLEKRIYSNVNIEANWGILSYYRNASVLGNEFIFDEPNSRVLKASGINASLYIKKYLHKKNWLAGAYMGGGIAVLNDKIDYQTNGGITGVPTDRFIEVKNMGLRYKMGYQTRWISNSYVDLSMITGYNFTENDKIRQNINYRYKKGLTGEFQIRLITAIHVKDTSLFTPKLGNTIKGSLWMNPAALFRKGLYFGAMRMMHPKTGTYATTDVYFYQNKGTFSSDYSVYGFQIGSRNYMNKECSGGYAGLFAGYNHLELQEFTFDPTPSPFPIFSETIRDIVKDQGMVGIQYGYALRSSKSVFIDIGLHNGLRFGNKPFVSSNNVTFDFPNGTYTKLFIKVGSYIY